MGTENNGGIGSCDLPLNKDVVVDALPASPWKTLAAASPVDVADPESFPALSEAQRSKNNRSIDLDSTKSLPPPEQSKADGSGPSPATPAQVEKKFHRHGDTMSANRTYSVRQNKTSPNHVPYNLQPQFPGHFPHKPPEVIPYFHHIPPISASGHINFFPPRAFLRPDFQLGGSCTDHAPSTSYLAPQNKSYAGGRPGMREHHGQMYHQRPVASNNFYLPQNMVPRPFMRPPFLGPAGFVDGSDSQGPLGTIMYYYPHAPTGSVAPYPLNPGVPRPPSPTKALKDGIVMQIEYYFSDVNLQHDQYLKSLMDDQGWVPISIISNFRRVKAMKTDIPFILNALQTSDAIEVKDEKVRRRNDWSKWVSNNHDETKRDSNEGKSDKLELEQTTTTDHPRSFHGDMEACGVTEEASGVGCAAERGI